jgi:hypothetical protein
VVIVNVFVLEAKLIIETQSGSPFVAGISSVKEFVIVGPEVQVEVSKLYVPAVI